MDFVTGLPPVWHHGQLVDAIFVVADRFSKMAFFFPVSQDINANELAALFHEEIETKFGPPKGIVSDRGSVFLSKFWTTLFHKCNLRYSTAFHPQTDGQTERMNQILEHYLRCFVGDNERSWATLLHTAQFAVNSHINRTTNKTPFEVLLGWNPSFYADEAPPRTEDASPEERKWIIPAVKVRIEKLEQLRKSLQEHWQHAVEASEKDYNAKHIPMVFNVGQWVMLSSKNLHLKGCAKLKPRFIGPFQISQKIGSQAYRLYLPEKYSQIHNVFNVAKLEPWKSRAGDVMYATEVPDLEDQDTEYEVEEVRDHMVRDGEKYFLVKWADWPVDYNEWVWEGDMENAKGAIQKYMKTRGARKEKMRKEAEKDERLADDPKESRPMKGKRGRQAKAKK